MKKLTKMTLVELAEVMPVISEEQQEECVGGFYFVGATGNCMGENNLLGDRISVISGADYNTFQAAITNLTLPNYDNGTWLSDLNNSQKINVYRGFFSGEVSGFNLYDYTCVVDNDSSMPGIYINSSNELVFNDANYQLDYASGLHGAWGSFISGFEEV